MAELVGIEVTSRPGFAEDSPSVTPLLSELADDEYEPHPLVLHDDYTVGPVLSLRDGILKLIAGEEMVLKGKAKLHALFNLKDNPTEDERQNLIESGEYADVVQKMITALENIFHETDA